MLLTELPKLASNQVKVVAFALFRVLVLHEIRLDGLELLDLQSVEDRKSLHFSFGELCCCPHILYMVRGRTALEPNCTSIGVGKRGYAPSALCGNPQVAGKQAR